MQGSAGETLPSDSSPTGHRSLNLQPLSTRLSILESRLHLPRIKGSDLHKGVLELAASQMLPVTKLTMSSKRHACMCVTLYK